MFSSKPDDPVVCRHSRRRRAFAIGEKKRAMVFVAMLGLAAVGWMGKRVLITATRTACY